MVKEVEVEATLPNVTAKKVFEILYKTDRAGKALHAKVNKDPSASFSAWVEGKRTGRFSMPVNVPAMLKKMIGLDVISVVETQTLQWKDAHTFTVHSEPQLNFPGSDKFVTTGFVTVTDVGDGSCKITAMAKCSAGLAWPLQSTVEAVMAQEAAASLNTFLDFGREYVAQHLAEPVPERLASRAASLGQQQPGGEEVEEVFFDAAEAGAGAGGLEGEEGEEVVPYQPQRLEDVILSCLTQIQRSSAESAQTLKALQAVLTQMSEDIHAVRAVIAPRRGGGGTGATAAVGGSTMMTAGVYLLSVGAVVSTGAFMYMRYRGRSAR